MHIIDSFRAFRLAGKDIASAVQKGEKITPILVKSMLEDAYLELTSKEVLTYTHYLRGLIMNSASSNMSYHETLGYSVQKVNINDLSVIKFSTVLRDKANSKNMAEHPYSRHGMSLTESCRIAELTYGFVGK